MSYVEPACLQNFTPMQIARMHTAIANSAVLRNAMLYIAGPDMICNSATYTLLNLPAGATVTWSVAPSNALTISGSGSSVTVTTTANFVNQATLSVSIGGVCAVVTVIEQIVSKEIISVAAVTAVGAYGQTGKLCRYSADNYFEIISNPPYQIGLAYEVQIRHWPSLITVYTTTTTYAITQLPTNFTSEDEYEIRARVMSHPCATEDWTSSLFEYLDDCISSRWNVSPNPVNETLSISLGDENLEGQNLQGTDLPPFSVTLYDAIGKSVVTGVDDNGKLTLDISLLLEGTYLLHIYDEGGITVEKRAVKIEKPK